MSKLKKLGSMLLALVFAIGMTCTALADDTYTIKLADGTTGYTYTVYQILTGDVSGKTLSNVAWGSSMTTDAEAALETAYSASGAEAVAEAIATANNAQALAELLADYTADMTDVGTLSESNTSLTVAGGYYLIVNTAISGDVTTYSNYIVEVVGDTEISPKGDYVPTFDKAVGDETDADEATEDYAVGDDVDFTLTATLPSDYADFDTYALTFHDTLSSGLSFNEDSVVVKVGNTVVASGYTLVTEGLTDGCSFEVQITDTNSLVDEDGNAITVSAGSVITVTYTAELTTDATTVYQTNTAYLEYSNNPNESGDGYTSTTPEDKTYVVNFTVTVDKVDENGDALEGAGFTLYKYDPDNADADEDGYVEVGVLDASNTDGTSFTINGLAVGKYKLVETTTPAGYNTADDIIFTIDAEATESTTGVTVDTEDVTDFTISTTGTTLSTEVENRSGSSLPSTGGMGTTIFYVVGGVLVAGAVVLLITKKRMAE
ncbi:MAG: isopeptide-forming domain-containing fimbrial protein [Clostridiales bacterium]|nr:isopeptide-forming domain-containing fimbrial protein [Clostridiales bacterium]